MNEEGSPRNFRCGYAAIVGEPNVGKSTLLNCLLGQKISIVTSKPQTTRHKILGILSTETYQIIFLDTPGLIKPQYRLQHVMVQSAEAAVTDADLLLYMIDAASPNTDEDSPLPGIFRRAKERGKPVFLVINKVDLVNKRDLLPLIDAISRRYAFQEIFPISALRADGTGALLSAIVAQIPEHHPLYPLDIVSEKDQRFFVAEIIREKIFLKCREEVPYSATVEVVEFRENEAGKWFISADIYVERESQKGIVIGKGGAMLKEIGQMARKEAEQFLDHPVFLELHVRVKERWREDEEWLKKMGYKGS